MSDLRAVVFSAKYLGKGDGRPSAPGSSDMWGNERRSEYVLVLGFFFSIENKFSFNQIQSLTALYRESSPFSLGSWQ